MKYRIVRKLEKGQDWWNSADGWTTLENAEYFDETDKNVLLAHFGKFTVSAIKETEVFLGWHLTGAAMVDIMGNIS